MLQNLFPFCVVPIADYKDLLEDLKDYIEMEKAKLNDIPAF
jgi:hypothetical protein